MPSFQLQSSNHYNTGYDRADNDEFTDNSSCRLMTTDDWSIHSLIRREYPKRYYIETHRLPLVSDTVDRHSDGNNGDRFLAKCIRSELPRDIQEALEIDPPVELLCIESDSAPTPSHNNLGEQAYLPRLLLYSRKGAYILKISYHDEKVETVTGNVVSFIQPLDRYLNESMETSIVRIRKAPQCSAGFATIAPATCFAALIENVDSCEYSLLLYHACGTVTTPLNIEFEDTEEEEQITDFCFARSGDVLSLLTSISVLLLKGSGDVYSASPVIFDGTIVSKPLLDESHAFLQDIIDAFNDRKSARWRHAKAAKQFLVDVFGHFENRSQFCTAQVLKQTDRSATIWPLKVQGPLLFHSEIDPGPLSVAIENFGSNECFVGVAVAKLAGKVDFASLSPTIFVPRFAFESKNDSMELDDVLYGRASVVERVDLCPDASESNMSLFSVAVAHDPINNHLLHYATPSLVCTISTNIMRITNQQLQGLSSDPVHTTAWACFNSVESIKGIAVSSDVLHGHLLYVGFEDKEVVSLDVGESSYNHKFDTLFQSPSPIETRLLLENETGWNSSPPSFSVFKPIVEKIQAGLSNMNRFVGSETTYTDITAETLAIALQTKKLCDKEIVLPLLELKRIVGQHKENLKSALEVLEALLRAAQDNIMNMQSKMAYIAAQMETAQTNATILCERSSAALQTSQKLLPTISQAEYDYFQMIKRMNVKCVQMENYIRKLNDLVLSKAETIKELSISESVENMDRSSITQVNSMLRYEGEILKTIQLRLTKTEIMTNSVAKEIGTKNQLC